MNPKKEWPAIKEKPISTSQLFTGYVAILALIPAVAYLIGSCLIGINLFGYYYRVPFVDGLIYAVVNYILAFVGIYLSAFIINALAPNFESKQNMNNALKLVAFSYTPIWIASIFSILTSLSFLSGLLGLYGLYLLYVGLDIMMETPVAKKIVYLLVVFVVLIIVYVVIGVIVGLVAFTPKYSAGFGY
jgi:hypothetical protein